MCGLRTMAAEARGAPCAAPALRARGRETL